MKVTELRKELDKLDKLGNQYWMASLSPRKREEMEFHNRDRDHSFREEAKQSSDTYDKFYGNKKYYSTTKDSIDYVENWIKTNAPGKICMDYACGDGANALKFAHAGAELAIGFDISNVSVENCRGYAKEQGVEGNTYFLQADAENTKIPSNSIDIIICSGMLHHLDLSYAFPELRRILKPGGKLLAVEALDYNPAIKLYRMMTPDMRTEWEKAHILSLKDIRFAKRFFDTGEVKYWHVFGYAGAVFKFARPMLNAIDKIATKIPGLKLMAWIFTFELVKPPES